MWMSGSTAPARSQSSDGALQETIEAVVKRYLAEHPEAIEQIVREYIVRHPEIVQDAITELMKRRKQTASVAANEKAAAIRSHAAVLFGSARHVELGNPKGDVTLVEFFDYNCGYCKRALNDTLALLAEDSRLRVVLKEYPVLGSASLETAEVAVAIRMQDPAGQKYLAFHREMLARRGAAGRADAVAVAREIGLDMARLERDLVTAEIKATLEENLKLAKALGITGTPTYVIGENVVVGAVGLAALKDKISNARK
jgi:protein-disulfide isomerase